MPFYKRLPFRSISSFERYYLLESASSTKKNYLTNIKSTTWPLHCNLLDFPNLSKLLRTSLVTYHTSFGRELTFLLSWGLVERLWEFPVHLKTINRENWKKISQTYFWRRSGRRQRIKERENRGHVILWQAVTYLWKNISIMIKKFKLYYTPELHLHVRWTLIGILWVTGKNAQNFHTYIDWKISLYFLSLTCFFRLIGKQHAISMSAGKVYFFILF
mgnify:CR=1 FL=1